MNQKVVEDVALLYRFISEGLHGGRSASLLLGVFHQQDWQEVDYALPLVDLLPGVWVDASYLTVPGAFVLDTFFVD